MASFGEELRRERELRDISLKEISEATKISIRFLEGLEQNNFDLLPGGIFNRGFVRAYARFIGVDAEEMVNAYLHEVSLKDARRGRSEGEASSRSGSTAAAEREPAQSAGVFRPETRPLGGAESRKEAQRPKAREFVPTLSRVDRPAPPPEAEGRGSMALWVLAAVVFAVGAGVLAVSFIPRREAEGTSDRFNQARGARLSKKAGEARPGPASGGPDAAPRPPAEAALGPVSETGGAASQSLPSSIPAPATETASPTSPAEGGGQPPTPQAESAAGAIAATGGSGLLATPASPIEHNVRVRAMETTRIQVECAGKLSFDQELWPNQMKSLVCAEPVVISTDNAGAVLLSLDGGPDTLLGSMGERVEGRLVAPLPPAEQPPLSPSGGRPGGSTAGPTSSARTNDGGR